MYYVDEESHSLVVIETNYNVQTGTIALIDDKLYIYSCKIKDSQEEIVNEMYDTKNDTLTPLGDLNDIDTSTYINNSWRDWYFNSNLKYKAETDGEHKIIFEWN